MRRVKIFIGLIFFSFSLYAQRTSELKAHVSQELSFGSFYSGRSGGTITISPDGNRWVTGEIILLVNSSGCPALLEIEAPPNRTIHVEFPVSAEIKQAGGQQSLTINNFTTDKLNNSLLTSSRDLPYGNQVRVGATLTVPGSVTLSSGNYIGNFRINVVCIQE